MVQCVICKESELIVWGLNPPRPDVPQETLAIYPCGHLIGAKCGLRAAQASGRCLESRCWCPLCNAVCKWSCGHHVFNGSQFRRMTSETEQDQYVGRNMIPPGQWLTPKCPECTFRALREHPDPGDKIPALDADEYWRLSLHNRVHSRSVLEDQMLEQKEMHAAYWDWAWGADFMSWVMEDLDHYVWTQDFLDWMEEELQHLPYDP